MFARHMGMTIGFGMFTQIPVAGPTTSVTTQMQVDAIMKHFNIRDATNPIGIAFAMVQLWYYHYPVKEVRDCS
jgi:hypothetical protein